MTQGLKVSLVYGFGIEFGALDLDIGNDLVDLLRLPAADGQITNDVSFGNMPVELRADVTGH